MGQWKKLGNDTSTTNERTWKWAEEEVLEGTYLGKKENVGEMGSNLYRFEVEDSDFGKEIVGVWGTSVLDNKLQDLKEGDKVRISYLGEVASKTKGRRAYKDFGIEVWVEQD